MSSFSTQVIILTVFLAFLTTETLAFGAGDIPDFGYLEGKAFRHGDIENILAELVKGAGHAAAGGGLLGFAKTVLNQASGNKFTKGDIKKVYFGNWLRDYSQAMDIAGLSKLSAETLVLIVSVLGFMTFGFATEEFEVNADRLGVYLPTEHIDNPKGYAEKEGDARQYHPKLRPPVDPRELEIDERTGMKNYIATEDGGWDSSTALIRRVFRECIELGRRAGGREGADLWESYRLLGTGLHTMEDLLAHSNWCELSLRKMGHQEVFCHVGDRVTINTPNGEAPPLVTGTFGGADFLHSLMGEATDHLSQASVTDLSQKMNQASQSGDSNANALSGILSKLPIGGKDDKMNQGEEMRKEGQAYNFDPDNIAPPEVQTQLWNLLKWRDQVYRDVLERIEMVPGLSDLLEALTNALNAYVYTVLAPYLTPILQQATSALGEGSKAVINTEDQYQVFDDDNASDPSHSLLSKDHFALILNEPAGKVAQLVVRNSVDLIVQAWADNSNPDDVINRILEAFHHPYYATGRSQIQNAMFEEMERWLGGLGPTEGQETIQALTKQSVRDGKNKRFSEENTTAEAGYGGSTGGASTGSSTGSRKTLGGTEGYGSQGGQQQQQQPYGQSEGRQTQQQSYRRDESRTTGYGRTDNDSYGSSNRNDNEARTGYGRQQEDSSYGGREEYGSSRREETTYGESRTTSGRQQEENPSYVRRDDDDSGHNRKQQHHRKHDEDTSGATGYAPSYGGRTESTRDEGGYAPSYGGRTETTRDEGGYAPSYGGRTETSRDEGGYGGSRNEYGGEGRSEEHHGGRRHHNQEENTFGERETSYGSSRNNEGEGYGSRRGNDEYGGGREQSSAYGGQRESEYGSESRGYGGDSQAGYGREETSNEQQEEFGGEGRRGGRRGGYGGGDDTFGAENLNINEEREY